jgi:hypothetical protein
MLNSWYLYLTWIIYEDKIINAICIMTATRLHSIWNIVHNFLNSCKWQCWDLETPSVEVSPTLTLLTFYVFLNYSIHMYFTISCFFITKQSMWNLWWPEQYWDWFLFEHFSFLLSVSFHKFSIFIFIHPPSTQYSVYSDSTAHHHHHHHHH